MRQTPYKFMISMEKRPWVAAGIKQALAQASQQYIPKRVFQNQGEGRGETLLRGCSQLAKQSIRMRIHSESLFGRTLLNMISFHSAPERLEEIGIQCCFPSGATFLLLPSGADVTLAVTKAEFSRAKEQRK